MSERELDAIRVHKCDFCGLDRERVRWLVGNPDLTSFICDVCILFAVHALATQLAGDDSR